MKPVIRLLALLPLALPVSAAGQEYVPEPDPSAILEKAQRIQESLPEAYKAYADQRMKEQAAQNGQNVVPGTAPQAPNSKANPREDLNTIQEFTEWPIRIGEKIAIDRKVPQIPKDVARGVIGANTVVQGVGVLYDLDGVASDDPGERRDAQRSLAEKAWDFVKGKAIDVLGAPGAFVDILLKPEKVSLLSELPDEVIRRYNGCVAFGVLGPDPALNCDSIQLPTEHEYESAKAYQEKALKALETAKESKASRDTSQNAQSGGEFEVAEARGADSPINPNPELTGERSPEPGLAIDGDSSGRSDKITPETNMDWSQVAKDSVGGNPSAAPGFPAASKMSTTPEGVPVWEFQPGSLSQSLDELTKRSQAFQDSRPPATTVLTPPASSVPSGSSPGGTNAGLPRTLSQPAPAPDAASEYRKYCASHPGEWMERWFCPPGEYPCRCPGGNSSGGVVH